MAYIKTITDINGDTYDIYDAGAQRILDSGVNIKTVNGASLLGAGDLSIDADIDPSVTTLFTELGWTAPSE